MANAKKEQNLGDFDDMVPADGFAESGADFDDLPLGDSLTHEDEIEKLKAERDDLRDRFMRALADAENARKRGERDRREAEMYGGTRLARDMLPVYDNLQRALATMTDEQKAKDKALIEGLELTMRELINVFKKHGIEPIEPQAGDAFDPQMHQAMFEAPVPGTKAGQIIQVMTTGFMIHDRLLRPAQVGVSSMPAK
jgi:molecular chaperone GrpE